MKNRTICMFVIIILLVCCTSCSSGVTMPHGSREYTANEWTLSEMEEHFDELGFSEVYSHEIDTYDTELAGRYVVYICDDSESEDAEYQEYEAGDVFSASSRVSIKKYSLIITANNCPEFKELLGMDSNSSEWVDQWTSFKENHIGDCLEFDGVLTHWYDNSWYISGVSFTLSVEGSKNLEFHGSDMDLSDLGTKGEYRYDKYHLGLINEGDRVRVLARIKRNENVATIDYESFEIIK